MSQTSLPFGSAEGAGEGMRFVPETGPSPQPLGGLCSRLCQPLFVFDSRGELSASPAGRVVPAGSTQGFRLRAIAPALPPRQLGHAGFCREFGLRAAYVAGAMAKGISSVELVEALSREGLLAFFGAGGLSPDAIETAVERLQHALPQHPWGVNLIHSPLEPALEQATVELLLRRDVRLVEAAAYLDMTLPLVRYRTAGIQQDEQGRIRTRNRVMAKVSREELAERFCSPPPEKLVRQLVAEGHLTEAQAQLCRHLPMADALTAEADSGGHTDNRPLPTVFPTLKAARDQALARHGLAQEVFIGAGGGIGTPAAAACAFALGADYIVTGSVNQACIEAGTSDAVRKLLAETRQADVMMAPAADMFEMGGRVQVTKRGTLFPMRAQHLQELYRSYPDLESLPEAERRKLEQTLFRMPLAEVWRQTQEHFRVTDPAQVEKAQREPRHRMALVFRWYLGLSPRWAQQGLAERTLDYQIWCGPAMGAFNEWARGSFLEEPSARRVADLAWNLLYGAALQGRLQTLRAQGIDLPGAPRGPLHRHQIEEYLS